MDDERIVISSSAAIAPEAVAGKGFTTAMRGYQPAEVRQFLNRVAEEMGAAAGREAELRRALHDAQTRAAHPALDEAVLTASLGEHAGRLIASARETAAAITAEAERTAAAILRDAEYRIARMRQEADNLMARRVDEADGVSASLRQSAEADARAVRDQAQAEAEAAVQAARSHGKEMVAEARAVRERMLGDLSRRRRVAEVQLEQLRVARERLVGAYDVVRRTLEEATAELANAEPEARLAAEAVGRRMADADPPTLRLAEVPGRTAGGDAPAPPRRPEPSHRPDDFPDRPAPALASPVPPGGRPSDHVPAGQGSGYPAPDGGATHQGRAGQGPANPRAADDAPADQGPTNHGPADRSGADHGFSDQGPTSIQPTRPVPPPVPPPVPMPAPGAPVSPSPDARAGADGPPVPPAWIERAGGSGRAASVDPPMPMPPSVALLVPAAGVGAGGAPAAAGSGGAVPPDAEADPGTWLGAGFGPPRDVGNSGASRGRSSPSGGFPRPSDPQPRPRSDASSGPRPGTTPTESSSTRGTERGGRPSLPGGTGGSAPSAAPRPSSSATALATDPAPPSRPPLRPQTVADSLPSRNRAVSPASSPSPAPAGPVLTSVGLRPVPPDMPRAVPPAPPEQPPELATSEVPAVEGEADGPAPVEELFARLRDHVPAAAPEATAPEATPPPVSDMPTVDVVDEAALARRDQELDQLDADLTRSLKRILQDDQNDVLERLRQKGRAEATSLLGDLDQQTANFTTAAAPALAAAYRAGGGGGDDTTGFALGGKLANDLATPLRERLERVVVGAGDDPDELAEAVRAAYRHAKLQEIEQLVRHHTAAAHALGAFTSAAGGALLRWVADDEGPCPDCYDNTLAGPTPKGEPYPTGQDHPPAHLGCRCLLVPADT